MAIKHPEQDTLEDPRVRPAFHAPDHAVNGLPTCKLCHRNFTKWQHLKIHIENGSCMALGGDSMKLHPPSEDNPAMSRPVQETSAADLTARAYTGTESQEHAAQNAVPLIEDESFISKLASWDQFLNCRQMRARLQSRCVVCGMWIAGGKHLKQHYNRIHHQDFPQALEHTQQLCLTFKSQFTRGRSCRYCGVKVGAPCRHAIQCTVLHQLCLAVSISQPEAPCKVVPDGRHRGGHLRTLHALWGGRGGSSTGSQKGETGSPQAGGKTGGPSPTPHPVRTTTMATDINLRGSASPGLPDTAPEQDHLEARGAASGSEEGHSVRTLLPAGRQVDLALPHECFSGVESQADRRGSIHTILPSGRF